MNLTILFRITAWIFEQLRMLKQRTEMKNMIFKK